MTSNNFIDTISQHFQGDIVEADLDKHLIIVCRQDGMPIFTFANKDKSDYLAIGALMAGVWQAASAISNYISDDEKEMDYRLGFDSSSTGIYLLPVDIGVEKMYMGILYKEVFNLGQLKMKFRMLAPKITEYWNKYHQKIQEEDQDASLFHNITDDEIDNMFAFSGN